MFEGQLNICQMVRIHVRENAILQLVSTGNKNSVNLKQIIMKLSTTTGMGN